MDTENHKKYPEGYFVNIWMAIGIAILSGVGISLGILTRIYWFFSMGPAFGVALGLIIGQIIENKYKKENRIRPLNEEEKRRRKIAVAVGIVFFVLGVLVFLLRMF